MAGESKQTTDHDTIREWTEKRDGVPATIRQTERGGEAGILRIHFPGYSDDDAFDELSWDEFFEAFEENELAFLYQEETKDGKQSRFFKFVNRNG